MTTPLTTIHSLPRRPRPVPERADPRRRLMADRFRAVMEGLGLDLDDPNLAGTPDRVARAYAEMFRGLDPANEPELRTFPNTEGYSQPVAMRDVPFHSLCAHHFLPFFGKAHVAYVPGERVVGLSKIARVVEYCAARPQVQEARAASISS